jgi:hypothetical protein
VDPKRASIPGNGVSECGRRFGSSRCRSHCGSESCGSRANAKRCGRRTTWRRCFTARVAVLFDRILGFLLLTGGWTLTLASVLVLPLYTAFFAFLALGWALLGISALLAWGIHRIVTTSSITELAPVHPELAWLADSARLVLKSGAEADLIPITTDLAAGPFYAVGLERGVQASATSFSTFDLIAFNDPSNPTDFVIVDGFTTGAGAPPTSASGDFGGAVKGHLFHVDGNTVTAWRAEAGVASLSTASMGDACTGFASGVGVNCAQTTLTAAFTITSALEDSGGQPSGTRTASLTPTTVAGILLSFNFP